MSSPRTTPSTLYLAAKFYASKIGYTGGIIKSTAGGVSWRWINNGLTCGVYKCGVSALVLDPATPTTLYAGSDGGSFKTTDGGVTWTRLSNGLPGETQRIGLSLHAKNPRVVYAIIQTTQGGLSNIDEVRSKRGGVFRSDDGGETWGRKNALNPRPFYFSQIRVDRPGRPASA